MANLALRAKYKGLSRGSALFRTNPKEQLLTASIQEQAPDTRSSQLGIACTLVHASGRARRYDVSGDGDRTLISLNNCPSLRVSLKQKARSGNFRTSSLWQNERRSTANCVEARITLQKCMHDHFHLTTKLLKLLG
jgi:hypothetical protein